MGDAGSSNSATSQLKISASLGAFGFIKHCKNIENTTRIVSFTGEGLVFQYDNVGSD